MRIKKIGIKNFRSYGSNAEDEQGFHWLSLENNIVFLIGQNDAGKSTALHAYQKLYTSQSKMDETDFHRAGDVEISICVEVSANNDEIEADKVGGAFNKDNVALVKKIWSEQGKKAEVRAFNWDTGDWDKSFGGFDTILQNRLPYPHFLKGFDEPEALATILSKIVSNMISSAVSQTEDYNKTLEALKGLSALVHNDEHLGEIAKGISASFTAAFPGSEVHISHPHSEDKIASLFDKQIKVNISYPERGIDQQIPLSNVGHGLQRHFILCAIQAASKQIQELNKQKKKSPGGIILIEEPELFLHPAKLRDIQNILYKIAEETDFQVVAATHSPVLVDLSRDHQTLARVKQEPEAGSSIFQINSDLFDDDEKARLSMINRFNPHVTEAFFSDDVLLVEGDTEVTAFRTLIDRLKDRADEGLNNVHVVNCMGKHTIPLFQRILRQFKIPYYAVHDLDTEFLESGNKNPAWSANKKISDEVEECKKLGLVVRSFHFDPNFEAAHDYVYKSGDGKVFSAYKTVSTWDVEDISLPAVKFIREVLQVATPQSKSEA